MDSTKALIARAREELSAIKEFGEDENWASAVAMLAELIEAIAGLNRATEADGWQHISTCPAVERLEASEESLAVCRRNCEEASRRTYAAEEANKRLREAVRLYETIFNKDGRVLLYSESIVRRVKMARTALASETAGGEPK